MRRLVSVAVLALLVSAGFGVDARAAALESIGEFAKPIFVTSDPVDPSRLLVVEREGIVVEVGPGGRRTFADLKKEGLVSCCESERGLLSIAPAPDFDTSGRFYAAYTGTPAAEGQEGDIHLDLFGPERQPGERLLRQPILTIPHGQNPNHNGGQLQFGPDGYLYLSVGDGGGGGDPDGNGQNTESLLGKILRIEPRPGQAPPYGIPAGNPFLGTAGRDEVWAYGLRNPWRFSFDRASGDMVIADVGQNAHEEIDVARSPMPGAVGGAGANYGWNCREGFSPFSNPAPACASASGFTEPVFDYPHTDPGDGLAHGCSIIGGYVVRDASLGDLYGRYLYTDYCTEGIRSLALPASGVGLAAGDRWEGLEVIEPTSFGEDSCGRIYVASARGPVYRLVGSSPALCPPASSQVPISAQKSERPHLRLSAVRLGKTQSPRFRLTAALAPCAGNGGRQVLLRRGGRRFEAKKLDAHCAVRFRVRVTHRSSFRALLAKDSAGQRLRSPRRMLGPAPR